MLPISGSSVMIRSISTLAWMKSPSVLRRTVPLMPMRQCSYAHRRVPVTYCCRTDIRGLSTVERKGSSRQSRSHSHTERSLKHELGEQNKLELPKEHFENKAESSVSCLAWSTTLQNGKIKLEAEIRYLDFFNSSKVRALSWKRWEIITGMREGKKEESTRWWQE